jgi:UDP-4-amino-4-deoxy-L-arabinose-oxoglutarate aminotransferase
MKVDFYRHQLGPDAAGAVADVLASPFLTTGQVCRQVEAQLGDYFGAPHAGLVNSWTNGALAVLLALDLKPGDEVVAPAMTFIATANVVVLAGATPVFCDVDAETLLMTPETLAPALTAKTRAVIPVHLYGQMCDMPALRETLDAFSAKGPPIRLIEDCAHCFEGERDGLKPGAVSDCAIFSFYATKNVTCGEGGAVVTRDADLHARFLESRLHGMSAIAVDRFRAGRYNHWDMMRIGVKANLPDLLAALLPGQIATIDARLPERARLADEYRRAFAGGPLRMPRALQSAKSAEHLFTIGVAGGARDAAIAALNDAGIGVTVNYRAVPTTSYYRARSPAAARACPVAVRWGEETISLPLFPGLTEAEQAHVIATVREKVYPLCASA